MLQGIDHAVKLALCNVWWEAFGNFNYLHLEYEVSDFKDGSRFLDIGYIRSFIRLLVEIDGIGSHWRNISRWQFSDHLRRQNDLVIDGWMVLRFSYDDVRDNPRMCQQKLQQFMGRWIGKEHRTEEASWIEKEIIRYAMNLDRAFAPKELSEHLSVDVKTARKWLHSLIEKRWLRPVSGTDRIRSYELDVQGKHFRL